MKLLTTVNNKTVKGEKLKVLTGVLYLAPARISGYEVCPKRSKGCTAACLFTAGMGAFSTVWLARMKKTMMFFEEREAFMTQLHKDVKALRRKALKLGMTPAIRLNGTSDIEWTRTGIMSAFPDVQFYDYTKVLSRLTKNVPENYHLTFSRSESNDAECLKALDLGHNVAVVYDRLPKKWMDRKVLDGDNTDARFLDRSGYVIGLVAKGRAKKDKTGFVVRLDN